MPRIAEKSPKKIYEKMLRELDQLVQQLDVGSDDQRISSVQGDVKNIVVPAYDRLRQGIADLERRAQWDVFTIAFYGETNAGKSTIIEALRILLAEPTKHEAWREFKSRQAKFNLTEARLLELQQFIQHSEERLEALRRHTDEEEQDYERSKGEIKDEIRRLHQLIDEKKKAASYLTRLLMHFRKTPEERDRASKTRQLASLEAERGAAKVQLEEKRLAAQSKHASLEEDLDQFEAELKNIGDFADGLIVGDGRPDFTRGTQRYRFECNGQQFELLDVPGIEGKEAEVMDSILAAMDAAHAVFYVTGKAAAPQTGDKKTPGTLEKIRKHLRDQTEVWTIFNKRITNPMQLQKGELTSQGERDSLDVLDTTMRKHLHGHYQHYIALSAQPAFLALAECLLPNSDAAHNREKFLASMSSGDLLATAGFKQFGEWLTDALVTDCDQRIRRSNFNKVQGVVRGAKGEIAAIQSDSIAPLVEQLRLDSRAASKQIDLSIQRLGNGLKAQAQKQIRAFESNTRQRIYKRIESDIGNDDFIRALEAVIRDEREELQERLPALLQQELEKFQSQVVDIVNNFRQRTHELLEAYGTIDIGGLGATFDLKIDIDSGFKVMPMVAALVGALLMWWNPVGWVSIGLGAATLLVSLGKAAWSMFSSSYKKSQQRKSADENIETIAGKMESTMTESIDEALERVTETVGEITATLEESVERVSEINTALINVIVDLTTLSEEVLAAGA
jgi:nicotinamide riboside kinase